MAKLIEIGEIKFKELASAINALNESGLIEPKIKTVGKSKEELIKVFVSTVQSIGDDETTGEWKGPVEAGEYYNKIMVDEPAAPETPVQEKKKREKKSNTEKKEKSPSGSGIIASILEFIKENGPITKEGILSKLQERFPDHDLDKMKKTVYAQVGGKKETRMEKEKGVKFEISEAGIKIV